MTCKKKQMALEVENVELKGKLEKLQQQHELLIGESKCHQYVADQATAMLSKSQKADLAALLIQKMAEVLSTGKLPNDDN